MKRRPVTEADVEEMRSLRDRGLSYNKIGAYLGFSSSTARKYLSNYQSPALYERRLRDFLRFQRKLGVELELFEEGFIGFVIEP